MSLETQIILAGLIINFIATMWSIVTNRLKVAKTLEQRLTRIETIIEEMKNNQHKRINDV